MDNNTNDIQKLQSQIESLQANVKWLYKYGGTGSGRGGSGSSSSSKWNIIAKLDDTYKLASNSYVLPTQSDDNSHFINISISRPGGLSFSGTLTISTGSANPQKINIKLNEANNWIYNFKIILTSNTLVSIALQDNEDLETKEISQCSIVVNQMSVNAILTNTNDTVLVSKDSDIKQTNIFTKNDIDGIKESGLSFRLNYNIANIDVMKDKQFMITLTSDIEKIPGLTADENYEKNTEIEIGRIDTGVESLIGQKNYTIFNPSNSDELVNTITPGVYNCNVKIYLLDSTGYPTSVNFEQTLSFTLVPDTLFLKVWCPTNLKALYNESDLDDLYDKLNEEDTTFNWLSTGYTALAYTPYYASDKGRNFTLDIKYSKVTLQSGEYAYDWSAIVENSIVKERMQYSKNIPLLNTGVYAINIILNNKEDNTSYSKVIYVGVKQGDVNLTYDINEMRGFAEQLNYNVTPQRFNGTNFKKDIFYGQIPASVESNCLRQYSNGASQILNLRNSQNGTSDIMISIGLQYSVINENNAPFITITANDDTSNIYIWQDKITISSLNDGNASNLYIKKEKNFYIGDTSKYHLLTIVRKNVSSEGSAKNELIVYYDGVSIGAYKEFVGNIVYKNISFNPANYYVNFIEYATFNTGADLKGSLDEIETSLYYYKFHYDCTGVEKSKGYLRVIQDMKFTDEGILKIDSEDPIGKIKDLAKELDVPLLNLVYNRGLQNSTNIDLLTWFTTPYEEGATINSLDVDVMWGNGEEIPLEFIDGQVGEDIFNDNMSKSNTHYKFTIKPQGSSTLQYNVKNLTLGIIPLEEQCQFIYTPNFNTAGFDNNAIAAESFLPEQKFVLKADHVDSSHANNTSIGRFVNKNTYKFDTSDEGEANTEKYRNYIKNALDGFPIVVFLTEIYKNAETGNVDKNVYLAGIYNFNLGRDSYFNLGYSDSAIFSNNITDAYKHTKGSDVRLNDCPFYNGFGIYKVVIEQNIIPLKPDLLVAEIQGNEEYYDFSQFDESLLVKSSVEGDSENYVMFGDLVYGETYKDNQSRTLRDFVKCVAESGYALFKGILQKNFSTDPENLYGYTLGYNASKRNNPTESINMVPNTCFQFERIYNSSPAAGESSNTFRLKNTWTPLYDTGLSVSDVLKREHSVVELINSTEGDPVDAKPMLDYCSTVEYYTLAMVFGLVDSVKKNLNVKSWKRYREGANQYAKFYIAFYDMDSSLGKDNLGAYVSYFAFSDYWKQTVENNTLKNLYIYRDFYPKTQDATYKIPIGYDVPSSYLFAIAKYAQLVIDSSNINQSKMYAISPESVYANLRSTAGELRNADYFIDNYFGKNLDNIPEAIWSLNYRNKYLKHTEQGFDNKLITAFKGRSKDMVKDWLEGRLHILDSYFGLNNISSTNSNNMRIPFILNAYNDEDGWYNIPNDNLQSKIYNLNVNNTFNNNPDVLILCDVFAEGNSVSNYTINYLVNSQGIKKSTLPSKNIDMSGLYLANVRFRTTGNNINYIFPEENVKYKVKTPILNNSQNISVLGSPMTTYMERIDLFITQDGKFNITSDYMTHICCGIDSDANVNCSSWNIYCPSLQQVKLTSEYYSGTLTLDNNAEQRIPMLNLDEINLMNSNINPVFRGLNIRTLNLTNIGSRSKSVIEVTGCTGIENLMLNTAKATDVTIQYTNMKDIVISGTSFNSLDIESIEREDDVTLRLSNDPTIQKLTVKNINHIIVSNCPNLNTIITGNTNTENDTSDSKIKTISITNCCSSWPVSETGKPVYQYDSNNHADTLTGALYIGKNNRPSNPSYELDLSNYNNLETINFNGTYGFTTVILPEKDIKVEASGFADTEMTAFSGCTNLILMGDSIFKNSNFLLTAQNCEHLIWDNSLTSLASMFECASNTLRKTVNVQDDDNIREFYRANNTKWANIISVARMLYGQQIFAALTTPSSVGGTAGNISFGRFVNLVNASEALYGTGWNTFCKEILHYDTNNYAGKNLTSDKQLNVMNIVDSSLKHLSTDAFLNAGRNIKQILWSGTQNAEVYLKLIVPDNSLSGYTIGADIRLSNLFDTLPNLICLQGVSFQPENSDNNYQKYYLNDCFVNNTKLVKINQAFNFYNFSISNTIFGLNNLGLKEHCPDLTHICASFNLNNPSCADNVEFINFVDWDAYCANNNSVFNNPGEYGGGIAGGLGSVRQTGAEAKYLNFNKSMTSNDIISILETIQNNSRGIINIKFLFCNTTFTDTKYLITANNNTYSNIIDLTQTFTNIWGTDPDTHEKVGLEFTSDSLKGFTNLISVSMAFQGNVMRGKLPPELFKGNSMKNMNGCFRNVSHQTFTNTNTTTYNYYWNNKKETDYVSEIYNSGNIKMKNFNLPYCVSADGVSQNDYEYATRTYIVPEDIFQCCEHMTDIKYYTEDSTYNAVITSCFADSDFIGVMPQGLFDFDTVIGNLSFENTFRNVFLMPQKYTTITKTFGNATEQETAYIYIPSNFTSRFNMFNCFDFRLILPASQSGAEYKAYYLFKSDSFKKYQGEPARYINGALCPGYPTDVTSTRDEGGIVSIIDTHIKHTNTAEDPDIVIHYGLCIDADLSATTSFDMDEQRKRNLSPSTVETQDNKVLYNFDHASYDGINPSDVVLGNVMNAVMSSIYYGNIVKQLAGTTQTDVADKNSMLINTATINNIVIPTSYPVLTCGNGSVPTSLSKWMVLPYASTNNGLHNTLTANHEDETMSKNARRFIELYKLVNANNWGVAAVDSFLPLKYWHEQLLCPDLMVLNDYFASGRSSEEAPTDLVGVYTYVDEIKQGQSISYETRACGKKS